MAWSWVTLGKRPRIHSIVSCVFLTANQIIYLSECRFCFDENGNRGLLALKGTSECSMYLCTSMNDSRSMLSTRVLSYDPRSSRWSESDYSLTLLTPELSP